MFVRSFVRRNERKVCTTIAAAAKATAAEKEFSAFRDPLRNKWHGALRDRERRQNEYERKGDGGAYTVINEF
jgi:hypothetical protein